MEKFSFFNDVDDDRIYFAEDFARHLAEYFTNGIFNNGCMVDGNNDNMSINVNKGSANINGYRYDNDDVKILAIENADGGLNRIDNVVIRLDLTNRMITTQVIKGDFAEKPTAPSLSRSSTVYDLRIAKISIPAGTTTITQDLITDTRFVSDDCGNVVQAVQHLDTEDIFKQYEACFNKWFDKVKSDFSNDAVGNLQSELSILREILGTDDNTFSESSTYEVDDMVVYNHKIYACIEEITQAGSWDSSKWQEISLLINE